MFMMTSATHEAIKRRRGVHLLTDEKMQLTFRIVDLLEEGIESELGLAKRLRVNTTTIRRYKPYALAVIQRAKLDRNIIRKKQIARTYRIIEQLTEDLKAAQSVRDRSLIYSTIAKYSNHLALITGLNYDSQVQQANAQQLVIVRPAKAA